MQSVDVISPTEYAAVIKVKIAFISAKFKLRTTIVERRAPTYLQALIRPLRAASIVERVGLSLQGAQARAGGGTQAGAGGLCVDHADDNAVNALLAWC